MNDDELKKSQQAAQYASSVIGQLGNSQHNQQLQQWSQQAARPESQIVTLKRSLQDRASLVAQRIAETDALEKELPKLLAAIKALESDE